MLGRLVALKKEGHFKPKKKGLKKIPKKGQGKFGTVMREFHKGKLHHGSKKGPIVTSSKVAKAIAASEAQRHAR